MYVFGCAKSGLLPAAAEARTGKRLGFGRLYLRQAVPAGWSMAQAVQGTGRQ